MTTLAIVTPSVPFIPAVYTVSIVLDRMDDACAFTIASPVYTALPFLPWEILIPTSACLPRWVVTHLCLLTSEFSNLPATRHYLSE
eukprot:4932698-Pleurochrysis_carterae.AAC.1